MPEDKAFFAFHNTCDTTLYAPMALGAVGSIMGCAVAGQAAIGAMLDTDSGYGRYVGVSVCRRCRHHRGSVASLGDF